MIKLSDVEEAFFFVSSASYGLHRAILDKDTGQIYYSSEMGDLDEIGSHEMELVNFIEIPHKNDLDLGQELINEFVQVYLPDEYNHVHQIFKRPGAYSRFKYFLESKGLLQTWYDFENQHTASSLRQWCEENGLDISDQ